MYSNFDSIKSAPQTSCSWAAYHDQKRSYDWHSSWPPTKHLYSCWMVNMLLFLLVYFPATEGLCTYTEQFFCPSRDLIKNCFDRCDWQCKQPIRVELWKTSWEKLNSLRSVGHSYSCEFQLGKFPEFKLTRNNKTESNITTTLPLFIFMYYF